MGQEKSDNILENLNPRIINDSMLFFKWTFSPDLRLTKSKFVDKIFSWWLHSQHKEENTFELLNITVEICGKAVLPNSWTWSLFMQIASESRRVFWSQIRWSSISKQISSKNWEYNFVSIWLFGYFWRRSKKLF
jgi:hypothetical protein